MESIIRAKETISGLKLKKRVGSKTEYEIVNFQNYVIIKNSDRFLIEDDIRIARIETIDNYYCRLYLNNNFERNILKVILRNADIESFENDLNSVNRFLIDGKKNINSLDLNSIYYDIETDDRKPLEKDFEGNIIAVSPILSIAYMCANGKKTFIKNENKNNPVEGEKKLLEFHNKIIREHDIIVGWNSKPFDDTYIKQRSQYHNISIDNWFYINSLDYLLLIKKNNIFGLTSFSLNNVSESILGKNKIEIEGEKGNGAIYNQWVKSFDGDNMLEKYNIMDVELIFEMEKKIKLIETYKSISDLTNIFIQEVQHSSIIWDFLLVREYHKKGLVVISKKFKDEIEELKEESYVGGGYTFCRKPGLHKNVEVFDFKSFYPTSITALNICNTTILDNKNSRCSVIPSDTHKIRLDTTKNPFLLNIKNKKISADKNIEVISQDTKEAKLKFNEKYFSNEKRGILSEYMGFLIEKRDEIKYKYKLEKDEFCKKKLDILQNSYKVLANSGYGVFGLTSFRFFDSKIANAITQFCRGVMKKCIRFAEDNGYEVIQGDTDSLMIKNVNSTFSFLELEEKFYFFFDELSKKMNINYKKFELTNPKTKKKELKNHFLVLEHEKTFNVMLSVMKKQYAALKYDLDKDGNKIGDEKISITGLECIKKDTNELAKELQKKLIETILKEKNIIDVVNEVKDYKQKFLDGAINIKHIIMLKTLSKNINEYGKQVIDSKTGKPKIKKDGTQQFAPIPAHVILAKKMIENGEEIFVGQTIEYIVKSKKPRIEAMSVKEFKQQKTKLYDIEYYWERVITPIIKILNVIDNEILINNVEISYIKEPKNIERHKNKINQQQKLW